MIETNQILQTDLLDLLFEGRNKLYGAYELRKKYGKRLAIAVASMILCCVLLFFVISYAFAKNDSHTKLTLTDPTLIDLAPEEKRPEPELPPPPKEKEPPIQTVKLTTPILTTEEIKPEDEIPDKEILEDSKIGKIKVDGIVDPDAIAPPIEGNKTGVTNIQKKSDNEDEGIVIHVQIESEYPGGLESWKRFLNKNIRYPELAIENQIQGMVIVQFIVDRSGNVSEVQAISGPNELRDEAVRVIRKSGQWIPAIQNGRQVKSYKRQPIIFKLEN
jgi:protein TonB